MPDNARWRLSLMMFLEYVIWGSWLPLLALYLSRFLGFSGTEIGWTYSVGPIAGMISPFFVGMVADRFFATERIMGVLHLLGGAIMLLGVLIALRDTRARSRA